MDEPFPYVSNEGNGKEELTYSMNDLKETY